MSNIKLTASQRAKIKRCVKGLNDVRREIQEENLSIKINWYLEDNDNLNLMGGQTHTDDSSYHPQYENVIEHFTLEVASGGAW
jgi:hypothetical protein